MTEANSMRVSLVQRTSFETAAALNMLVLASTGQTLRPQIGYQQSQTLRTDANVQDLVRMSSQAGGGIPFEFQFPVANEALWYLLRAALRATETAAAAQVTGVTSTDQVLTATGVGTGVEVGDVVQVLTSADVLQGYFPVTVSAANSITVVGNDTTLPNGVNYKVLRGARMKNGTERYWFDVEIGRLDTNLFQLFEKAVVNSFDLTVQDGAITTASVQLLGVESDRDTTSLCLGHTPPTAGPILDALGVPVFNVANVAFSAKSIGLSINHSIRLRTQITDDIGSHITGASWGATEVRSRISSYLQNWTEVDKYVDNTASSLWFLMRNENGQAISFSMPRMKWAELSADTRGLNQDDYLEGQAQSIVDPTQAISLRVQRWV